MKKLLTALECPFVDTVDLNVKSDVMRLVVWLEDRKIRELEISERELLKQSGSFDTAFVDYLARLQCPLAYTPTSQLACLNWLVGHAIGVEYEDSAEACKNLETTTGVGAGATGASGHRTTESTQALDREVNKLGALLGVPRATSDQGTADYLHTIAVKVRLSLSAGALAVLKGEGEALADINSFVLGFDTQQPVVNQVSTVLKMLHIFDFRELQNDLNALIVLGQEYTANPRTNNKLGKVGR